MIQKQNNVDSTSIEPSKRAQITSPETSLNSIKTRATVMLASLVIGGLVVYEKLSSKIDSSSVDTNTTPVEQGPQTTPESNNSETNIQDTVNSTPEKKNPSNNKYGNEISINNYDKYISNIPDDRKDSLNSTLYNIVKRNLKSDNLDITDANIRDGSVEYNFDKTTNINSGSFIVDMPSIDQSYMMTYKWTSDKNNANLGGYTATAACLSPDKLTYGDFDCEDDFEHSKNKTERNPILKHLPYSTFNYTITANTDDNNKIELNVDMILYSADTRDGERDNSIAKYKSEVVDWIKSKKLNPDDYSINYTIN